MPQYEQLPEHKRKKISDEGEEMYGDLIRKKQEETQTQINQSLNYQKYMDMLNTLNSNIEVDKVTKLTDGIVVNAKEGLSSTSLFC
jgi:hypothetical protein